MSTRDERLLDLAGRIADGDPVDWDELEKSPLEPHELSEFREVARIGDVHRRVLFSDEDEGHPIRSWGPLDVLRPLDSGGFSEVYLARDRNLDCLVALKLLVEEPGDTLSRTEFVEEARRLASVEQDNVVRVRGVDRFDNQLGIWMDRIDGESLEELIEERGPLGASEACVVGESLCRAVAAVHGAGLVHRDIKLSNVMRERGGRIVLMDFGSSTRDDDLTPRTGTLMYLAPEAFDGRDSGRRMDIYALGVALYRLVTGSYPVESPSEDRRPVPLLDRNPDLDDRFVAVVEKAMHADPDSRFTSAGEMLRALQELRVSTTPTPHRSAEPEGRRLQPWMLLVPATVLLAALLLWWFRPVPAPDASVVFLRASSDPSVDERLSTGARIAPGDQLFLDVDVAGDSWIYVFNEDDAGDQYLLFPLPGLDLENPLPPGKHQLPGTIGGEEQLWDVTSAAGREHLLVLTASSEVDFIESVIASTEPGIPGQPWKLQQGMAQRVRGIGGMSPPAVPDGATKPPLAELRRNVAVRAADQGGIAVWELTLSNPR